jgi:hypothetical protein
MRGYFPDSVLQRSFELSFGRDLVRPTYADSGRPSIDPVSFIKPQLDMFFERRCGGAPDRAARPDSGVGDPDGS